MLPECGVFFEERAMRIEDKGFWMCLGGIGNEERSLGDL